MKAYIANTYPNEEGPEAIEGKAVIIKASKEQIIELADFLAEVARYVEHHKLCHMHFMDFNSNWREGDYIDVSIDLIE